MKPLRHSKHRHRHHAFTLVELLTVLAIVGVLAGLLLSVLGRMRESGRLTRCAANLRQIGMQLITYANDNRGIAIVAYDVDKRRAWSELLCLHDDSLDKLSKVGEFGVWRCPQNTVQEQGVAAGMGETNNSYGINGWARSDELQGIRYTGARVAAIANPARLYMLTEAAYSRIEEARTDGNGTVPEGLFTSGPSYLRYAHRGRLNMVYADGHVELLTGPLLGRGTHLSASSSYVERFSNGVRWYSQ